MGSILDIVVALKLSLYTDNPFNSFQFLQIWNNLQKFLGITYKQQLQKFCTLIESFLIYDLENFRFMEPTVWQQHILLMLLWLLLTANESVQFHELILLINCNRWDLFRNLTIWSVDILNNRI